ncbi:YqhA family protein [bacterium]|nr:MAG: YqhA family protein [bacterium]
MFSFLAQSRYVVLLGVIGSFICATLLLVYGLFDVLHLVAQVVGRELDSKKITLGAIESIDVFLLATVFYIIAIGLYELFIDNSIPVPEWMMIHSLDDLKSKLLGVVVTVLGVLFLGQVVSWNGQTDLQPYGISIAAVIAAITYYTHKNEK